VHVKAFRMLVKAESVLVKAVRVLEKALCTSCEALFYRRRLPQQNGDRRKRDLHAFKCM
jgi:hypothetical protein